MQRRSRFDEEGFTLPEILISLAILTLITGAIGSSMVLWFRTDNSTIDSLTSSHERQMLANYLAGDAQSARTVLANDTCGTSTAVLLRMHWDELIGSVSTNYDVIYGTHSSGVNVDLVRTYCINNSIAESTTVIRDLPTASSVFGYASGYDVALTLTDGTSYAPVEATRRSGDPTTPAIGTPPPLGSGTTTVVAVTTTTVTPTTTQPPLVTTTVPVTPTTTVAPTTTTTTPPSCSGTLGLSPSPTIQGSKLKANVTATFTPATNAVCSGPLTLYYAPGSTLLAHTMTKGTTTWTFGIDKNAEAWTSGSKTFTVYSGSTKTAELVVTL